MSYCPDCAYLLRRVKELEAERDTLREDAERYRWLRDEYDWDAELPGFDYDHGDTLDSAIDAARGKRE